MIISASRRTDIPSFYSQWFFNRIRAGNVVVKNPFNPKQERTISLKPETVDFFVFWTKDPRNMLDQVAMLKDYGFRYYFQFTLTAYDSTIEKGIGPKGPILDSFLKLAKQGIPVVWRYDPILLSDKFTEDYHYRYFRYLGQKLQGAAEKCVISFVELYAKSQRNLKQIALTPITIEDQQRIARNLQQIASEYQLTIESCVSGCGLPKSRCVDPMIVGLPDNFKRDPNQRPGCSCVHSVDIGAYNTCRHYCLYCYANYSAAKVRKLTAKHDPDSPWLIS